MEKTYHVVGMKCQGCVQTVTEKLSKIKTVEKVVVDLEKQTATVTGSAWKMTLNRALKDTNFHLK